MKKEWKDLTLEEVERLIFKTCDEEDLKEGRIGVKISSIRFKRYKDINTAIYSLKKSYVFSDKDILEIRKELKEKGYLVSLVNKEYYGNLYLEMIYVKIEPKGKVKTKKVEAEVEEVKNGSPD